MKVVLSTYPGSFRLPNEVELWLLRDREAFHLYNSVKIEDSNFALRAVSRLIEEDNEFSGKYDDTWGWYNSSIVHLDEMAFYGLRFSIKSGSKHRTDNDLIAAIEKFEPDDFQIASVDSENFKIETGINGEYIQKHEPY